MLLYASLRSSIMRVFATRDFVDGKILPPSKPGLGIELNRDAIKKYQVA